MGYFLTVRNRDKQKEMQRVNSVVGRTRVSPPSTIQVSSKTTKQHHIAQPVWLHDIFPNTPWRSQSCVVLGGGPSIGTIKSFDFISRHRSIAVNKSFLLCDTDLAYSMDSRFYAWLSSGKLDSHANMNVYKTWEASRALKTFLVPNSDDNVVVSGGFGEKLIYIKRSESDNISVGLDKGIYSANNSLFGAVALAIAMGASPIYVLGADMSISRGKTHWHCGYPDQEIRRLAELLESYVSAFNTYASKMLAVADVFVVGNSVLNCFPKCSISSIS